MNNEYSIGLNSDVEEGLDKTSPVSTEQKVTRKPFAYWTVGEKEFRLKLKTSQIAKLEEKYKKNLLFLITGEMPTVAMMLTVIQAAAAPWNSGVGQSEIMDLYDEYVEEGHTQQDLLEQVLLPTMGVSGFLSAEQMNQVEMELSKR